MLIHTDVTRYLEFKSVDGSYVVVQGKVHKVPATDVEALKSPLMGMFEKRRCKKFFMYVQEYDENNSKTHQGTTPHHPLPSSVRTTRSSHFVLIFAFYLMPAQATTFAA